MNKAKAITGILAVVLLMPIWFYLLYQILARVESTELMWFLYWVYVPLALLAGVINKIAEARV